MKFFYQKITVLAILVMLSGFWTTAVKAQILYSEGFNTVAPLPAGWAQQNLSNPIGTTPTWFQGNATVFPANSGATTAYIGTNFNNVGGANTISNWLFAPNVTLKNGDIFTFYTRSITASTFPDRLQVRMSTNGTSVNAGTTATSVGDFTTLLLDINPTYTAGTYPQVWTQFTITLSGLAAPISGRIAFRYFVEDGGPLGNNSDYIGIDDAVYTTFSAACSGTPIPGNTISSAPNVCPITNFNLSFQNNTSSGLTYQWQSSPDNVTWTNIAGATLATLTTTQSVATWYRCNVTCTGNTAPSTPLQVTMSPATSCYCTAGSPDVTFEKISNVKYNTINNSSTATSGYENFTAITTDIIQQSTLPITVTISNSFNSDQVIVWIDFNQNGSFTDPGERVYISAQGNGPHTGNITIPATSLLGSTRMRIRMHDAAFGGNVNPCGNSAYGQVEDYTVNIVPCVPLAITTEPGNATIECGGNATFTVGSTGSGPSWQWEQRTSASAVWTTVTNGGVYSGATTNTLIITAAPVSMNGYQYRAVFSGYCRSTDFTQPGTLTVNPLAAVVNPSSANICNGTIQQLTLTNITSPLPATTTVASGPLAIVIPDGTPGQPLDPTTLAGINHTINVAGIPAAALITSFNVKLNIPHTYVGDLAIVLKAPNGQIFNLDYLLTATGGGVTTGFVNTVISSVNTFPALSTGTNPYTGTFRADAVTAGPFGPAGPTGYIPTTALWSALTPTGASANGAWTIAMYDAGPIDQGTLTSWDLTINYLAGIPATGVWGPTTPNTIFTDAAATIPYVPGTPANGVYVLPTTTTTYTVVVTTPLCVSNVTNIPVTVSNPVGTITDPTNAAICENDNTSFTVSAASGNAIAYRWQVSTDAGVTWTNLSNGSVYGGTTTPTLTLTGVPVTYNNYQYRAVLSVAACASTVNSGAAILTVNPIPTVTIPVPAVTQLYPGITTTLTANSSPAGASYQWFRDGVAIPGATASTLTVNVDELGEYSVAVVDVNGCSGASTASQIISAAPNDILFIYPSPTTGQFQVRYQSLDGNLFPRTLTIFDSKGSRVYTKIYTIEAPYSRMDVDLKNHGKGVYRVELGDRNGKRIKTGSVIVL